MSRAPLSPAASAYADDAALAVSAAVASDGARPRPRLRLGRIHADVVTFDEAIDEIVRRACEGSGGIVVTPNVHHVCVAEHDAGFRAAYEQAALSLVDGQPLVWASRALGQPLPAKISGSDVVGPLMARAAVEGLRVYFLGASPDTAARAIDRLRSESPGLVVAGMDHPMYSPDMDPSELEAILGRIRAARPHLVVLAMGCPRQEYFLARHGAELAPAVLLGAGAALDFLAGDVRRAPDWVSRAGVEWIYRILQEPKRLWRRYLVDDRPIAGILVRQWRDERRAGAPDARR